MGKGSRNKKVARAASTGGGRTARGRTPWMWYGGLASVVAVGTLLVVTSRSGLDPTIERPNFQDHWHTAYGVYICDEFKPPMVQPQRLLGLHTHTDGLIHVEPQVLGSENDTGRNANVGRFEEGQPGFRIDEDRISFPGDKTYRNGDKCDGKRAEVRVVVWEDQNDDTPETISGDPDDIRILDQQLITFAFVPEGTTVPKPPSVANLADPNAGEANQPGQPAPTTPPTTAATSETTTAPTPTTAAP